MEIIPNVPEIIARFISYHSPMRKVFINGEQMVNADLLRHTINGIINSSKWDEKLISMRVDYANHGNNATELTHHFISNTEGMFIRLNDKQDPMNLFEDLRTNGENFVDLIEAYTDRRGPKGFPEIRRKDYLFHADRDETNNFIKTLVNGDRFTLRITESWSIDFEYEFGFFSVVPDVGGERYRKPPTIETLSGEPLPPNQGIVALALGGSWDDHHINLIYYYICTRLKAISEHVGSPVEVAVPQLTKNTIDEKLKRFNALAQIYNVDGLRIIHGKNVVAGPGSPDLFVLPWFSEHYNPDGTPAVILDK